jgi:REP element-mobilizing transposase RayT
MTTREQRAKGAHGGKREGAGRPKSGRRVGPPHRARPELSPRHPVHVSLKLRERHPDLRTRDYYKLIHDVMEQYLGRDDFRIVHGSIQNTHLHFIVEAANKRALSRGMQSLALKLSYAIGGTRTTVFRERYHATQITTPRQARNALAYVLNNWRRHRMDAGAAVRNTSVDPYSTGITFDGWSKRLRLNLPRGYAPLPTSPPRTTLLRSSWQWFGLIDPFERPGPLC